jgi:hypothetical protein
LNGIKILSKKKNYKNEILRKWLKKKHQLKSLIAKRYTSFLLKYSEIFSDLVNGSNFDFAIYDSFKAYDDDSPVDIFNVLRNGHGIEIKPGNAVSSDLELALSSKAIEKLIQTKTKLEYTKLFGHFCNEPDEEKGWIDFVLHKRTQALIDMG